MTDSTPLPVGLDPVRTGKIASGATRAGERKDAPQTGAVFEALFERLTSRAAELEARTRSLSGPDQLPQAVDAARASLEDALDLGRGLLEAFRAAQQNKETDS